jgi:hypothetical protein
MTRVIWCTSFVAMLGIAGLGSRNIQPTSAHAVRSGVTEFTSTDEVVTAFLDALERKDVEALRRLRVTESEYKDLVLAGHVPVGTPFRSLRPEVRDFAWQTLNTKSMYMERFLVETYGGRRYELQGVRFEKETEQYAGFSAHKQLRLSLVHDGVPFEIGTGSIVDVGGRYKFASFIRD